MKNALLQHQKMDHAVTKKLENVERMKGIVIMTAIAKLVSSVAQIIAQLVSHQTMTAAIKYQVFFIIHHKLDLMCNWACFEADKVCISALF